MKKLLILAISLAFSAFEVFAQSASALASNAEAALDSSAAKINSGLEDFSKELRNTVPNLGTTQNVYPDAFIGKIFPAIPPHFAVGANFGLAALNTEGLSDAADAIIDVMKNFGGLDIDMSVPSSIVLPTVTLDLRAGGFVLPFDFGITAMLSGIDAMKIDANDKSSYTNLGGNFSVGSFSGEVNFFTLGFDVRYALLEDGLLLPGLSVGAGYVVSKGAVSVSGSDSKTSSGVKNSVDSDLAAAYVTQTMYLQAQVSKKFFIITPFLGARMLLTWSDNAYSWNVNYTASVSGLSQSIARGSSDTITRGVSDFYLIPQLYFGTGINLLFFQLSASAGYDLRDSLLFGALSLRFKL